jgi:hypothetical protein
MKKSSPKDHRNERRLRDGPTRVNARGCADLCSSALFRTAGPSP